MKLNSIFDISEYSNAIEYINTHSGTTIEEVAPDTNGTRFFKIVNIPAPTEAQILLNLRIRRDTECFVYINRGVLWYNTLTTEQQQQLNTWYQEWLDVPQVYLETKPTDIETIIPTKPNWLK